MPVDIKVLCRTLKPEKTILIFGAGSSIPSGGPSSSALAAKLLKECRLDPDASLTLSDAATIVENQFGRRRMFDLVRASLAGLRPSGGLLNIPMFDWASIYTTNYDTLVEQVYARQNKTVQIFSSNFDFDDNNSP